MIKRYDLVPSEDKGASMEENALGDYVEYQDYEKEITRLGKIIGDLEQDLERNREQQDYLNYEY